VEALRIRQTNFCGVYARTMDTSRIGRTLRSPVGTAVRRELFPRRSPSYPGRQLSGEAPKWGFTGQSCLCRDGPLPGDHANLRNFRPAALRPRKPSSTAPGTGTHMVATSMLSRVTPLS